MKETTGVFICGCSNNISGKVDTGELAGFFSGKENCVVLKHDLLCSEGGREFMKEEIRTRGISRVAIGGCSPRQHEQTFRKVCSEAGLNPFMMQMANIREMCAWVVDDVKQATEKARVMVNAAVERVKLHEEIEQPEIEVNPDALVIGAGVAGMSAALLLAQKGRKVCLVEKAPCIGGMTVRYEDVFPGLECAPCMLEPMMDEVLHDENIEVLTYSEIEEVKGFLGNFIIKIRKKARSVVSEGCFGCGECFGACPVSVPNEYNQNMNGRKAIYWPFAGALPNVPVIDRAACVRFTEGTDCDKCAGVCGFGAVDFSQEDEILERKVGAVVLATGFDLYDPAVLGNLGYGRVGAVITTLELERLIASNGPTEGKVELNGAPPRSVAFVHCAGSRSKDAADYCSGICCMESLKLSHLLKSKIENVKLSHIYVDLCLPGKTGQEFYRKIAKEGATFLHVNDIADVKVSPGPNGYATVEYTGVKGEKAKGEYDMVVLATAVVPRPGTRGLAEQLQVTLDGSGFVKESNDRIDAVATNFEGVYSAGCVTGPMDIAGAANAGKAAAGEILSSLVPGEKIVLTAATAFVDEELCSGCRICNTMCPYKAISFDEEKKVTLINHVLCQGCGTCVAACPSGAIGNRHFSREQIFAEIAGVLA